MIDTFGKVKIFVNNQDEAKAFWVEKLGFVAKIDETEGPLRWIEVAPSEDEFATLILYDKNLMLSEDPYANVGHPSIILSTKDVKKSYEEMKAKGIEVGELMVFPYATMFSFKDQDNNEYLLREN